MSTAGKLDQRITLERRTRTPDGMGGFTEDWVVQAAVWAQVMPLRGSERWEAMRVTADARMKVRIRWRGDENGQPFYTPADRLLWRGRIYNIESVTPWGGRQAFIEIGIVDGAS